MADPQQNNPKPAQPQSRPHPQQQQTLPGAEAEGEQVASGPEAPSKGPSPAGRQQPGTKVEPLDLGARGDAATMTPTRKASIAAGEAATKAARAGQPRVPSAGELQAFRDQHFGPKPGVVRVDSPPQGSRVADAVTKLVFFDERGTKVHEREYYGPEGEEA